MKKIYFLAVVIFTTILLILFVFYNQYSEYYEDEKINSYISKNINILNDNLNFEKQYALSLSLFISKNKNIKKALYLNNQTMALQEIDRFLQEIKNATGIDNIDIQVHTQNLEAFARSWDKSDYRGLKLAKFRKGLVEVKKGKKSIVSIELGNRLNIKAISPILDKNHNFIGSIEIIIDFKNIEKRLKKFGLEILPLLDKKFSNIALSMKENQKIDRYIVTEKRYTKKLYKKLQKNLYVFDKSKFYYKLDDTIIIFVPMLSIGVQDVGVIALSMDLNKVNKYNYPKSNIENENSDYKFNKTKRKVVIK